MGPVSHSDAVVAVLDILRHLDAIDAMPAAERARQDALLLDQVARLRTFEAMSNAGRRAVIAEVEQRLVVQAKEKR